MSFCDSIGVQTFATVALVERKRVIFCLSWRLLVPKVHMTAR